MHLSAFRAPLPFLFVSCTYVLAAGCGQARESGPNHASAGAGGWAGASGAAGAGAQATLGGAAVAGAPGQSFALDASDCAQRPVSDCQGVQAEYSSGTRFDDTPAFARCSRYNSYDGCQSLSFAFDAEGCAVSVFAQYESPPEHLRQLRECLSEALQAARWPCLASGALVYHESCFVR